MFFLFWEKFNSFMQLIIMILFLSFKFFLFFFFFFKVDLWWMKKSSSCLERNFLSFTKSLTKSFIKLFIKSRIIYVIDYAHVKVQKPAAYIEEKILQKICVDAAEVLDRQAGRKYDFSSYKEKPAHANHLMLSASRKKTIWFQLSIAFMHFELFSTAFDDNGLPKGLRYRLIIAFISMLLCRFKWYSSRMFYETHRTVRCQMLGCSWVFEFLLESFNAVDSHFSKWKTSDSFFIFESFWSRSQESCTVEQLFLRTYHHIKIKKC